ncbi:hypothetical protein PC111_g21143 [Phytophthora cactorum]|nr:hypothetical protein PC111_g21143 [Phytophthora cactorum]KAG2797897.1 hypothetical protein PC112_g21579 [Phytophthora cactorum]KAG2876994.1 hypothetical protein PC114_g23894 [Phytophthora cactorum]
MIRASRVPTDSFHGVRHWELLAGCDVAFGARAEVARLIKQQHPREFKDIPAARIRLFALLKGGNYTPLWWDYKSSTIWDLKIYLKKTHFLPAHFKLVLGKDGDQVVMCKEWWIGLSSMVATGISTGRPTRRLDEVERLHCDASAYKIKVAMAEAARHNQVEVVKYLIKRYKTYNTRLAVETADAVAKLKHGRVDILKSFENDSDYETDEDYEDRRYERMEGRYRASDVLGEAARAGHREAVRWILDAARVESKTIHVIERAVRDGRHDVVVLLCSCCTKEERYLTLYRGISLRSTLDAIKAILRRVLTRKTGRYCGNTATKIQAPRRGDSQVST